MTIGQRIAQKRKELGLSQEGLGERLGVSRQAIYKWESDAALPEIEKLVKLGREFGVPVGWLLGEEDGRPELTAEQLRMVEEIVGRYLDARPAVLPREAEPEEGGEPEPPKPKRRRWPRVLAAGAAALVVIGVFSSLFSRLEQMRQENQSLQMAVANIRSDVNSEIYSITRRVEEVLQSQNDLTAEQSAWVADADYRANTVTIQARVVPRTYVEGMTAEFLLVSGDKTFTAAGELGENHAFTASVTVPLTDGITVSAAFLNGDQRQTQVLREFTSLYSDSFPSITVSSWSNSAHKSGENGTWTARTVPVDVYFHDRSTGGAASLSSLRVGLFRDQKLVEWLTEDMPPSGAPDPMSRVFRLGRDEVPLENGHTYCVAAVVVDQYGREWVVPNQTGSNAVSEDGEMIHDWEIILEGFSSDPADWEY